MIINTWHLWSVCQGPGLRYLLFLVLTDPVKGVGNSAWCRQLERRSFYVHTTTGSSKCANNNELCESMCCPKSKNCPPRGLKGLLNPGVVSPATKTCGNHVIFDSQGMVLGGWDSTEQSFLLASSLSLESALLSFTAGDTLSPSVCFLILLWTGPAQLSSIESSGSFVHAEWMSSRQR